jgi:hypothetical protein
MEEQKFLNTVYHRCAFDAMGVNLYNTESLEEGETPDTLLKLSYTEALEIARYILAHEVELETRKTELEAQFTQLSEALIDIFAAEDKSKSEEWQREVVYIPGFPRDFNQLLSVAYKHLKGQKGTQVQHWCNENEEQEALFWLSFERFFYEHHRDDLIDKFSPEEDENVIG